VEKSTIRIGRIAAQKPIEALSDFPMSQTAKPIASGAAELTGNQVI